MYQIDKRISEIIDLRNIYEELRRGNFKEDYFNELYEVNPFMSIG